MATPQNRDAEFRAEFRRFREALPRLLARMPGKWVVFHEGQVVARFDDFESAYADGLTRFGQDGTHVVDRVEEPRQLRAAFLEL